MFKSIKSKLVASFLISITLCIGTMAIIISQIIGNTIKNDFIVSTRNEMIKVEDIVGTFFTEMKNNGEMLSQNETVKKADRSITSYVGATYPSGEIKMTPKENGGIEKEIYYVYENFAKTHPNISDLFFGTAGGNYVQYADGSVVNNYDPRKRPWYKQAIEDPDNAIITDAYYWAGADAVRVSIVKAAKDNDGNIIGVQAMDVELDGLTDMISELRIGESGYVIIVEGTGKILSHPAKPDLNFKNIEKTYLKDFSKKQSGSAELTDGGKNFIANIHTSKENGWKYISIVPKAELLKKTRFINVTILIIGLSIMIISVIVSALISKDISRPIQNIRDLMKQVENGNFNVKSVIKGKDEVAQLGNSFNNMTENVKGLIQSSKHISEDIIDSADLLSRMSDQVLFAAEEMTYAISDLAMETYEQAKQTNGILGSVEHITDEIGSVSHNIEEKIDIVKKLIEDGIKTPSQVSQIVEEMKLESVKLNKSLEKMEYEREQTEDVICKISSSSDHAAATSEEMTALSQEQTASIYKMTDSIKNLRDLSNELKDSISKFSI